MKQRISYRSIPGVYSAMLGLEKYLESASLDKKLMDLVRLRVSQINGCAYCVDMHVKESRHDGLSEQWINLMCVWRESPIYDAKERALLGWVDAVTRIAETGAPDADFEALKAHFTEEEITKITVAIGTINVWNRLAVGFRSQHPIDKPARAA